MADPLSLLDPRALDRERRNARRRLARCPLDAAEFAAICADAARLVCAAYAEPLSLVVRPSTPAEAQEALQPSGYVKAGRLLVPGRDLSFSVAWFAEDGTGAVVRDQLVDGYGWHRVLWPRLGKPDGGSWS